MSIKHPLLSISHTHCGETISIARNFLLVEGPESVDLHLASRSGFGEIYMSALIRALKGAGLPIGAMHEVDAALKTITDRAERDMPLRLTFNSNGQVILISLASKKNWRTIRGQWIAVANGTRWAA